jgi:hypothetical protein
LSLFFENGFRKEFGTVRESSGVDSVSFGATVICFSSSLELFSES